MFNSIVLDVFIGLVFIFLLYSLLATILQEMIARWFNLRSRMLQKAVRRMLEDDKKYSTVTLLNFFVETWFAIVRFFDPDYRSNSKFTKAFFEYPAIKYLAESAWNSKPAYLSASDFSQTLIHLLLGNNYDGTTPKINLVNTALFTNNQFQPINGPATTIDPETLNHLRKTFLDSNNDIDRFKNLLENWFNNTMDRTTGWYKRQNKLMLFLLGLFIAYNFNVDTIAIYNLLAKDKTARENLVQLAITSDPKYAELKKQLIDSPAIASTTQTHDTTHNQDTIIITNTITNNAIASVPDSVLESAKKIVMSDIEKAGNIAALGWPDKDSCKKYDSLKKRLESCSDKDSADKKQIESEMKKYAVYKCEGNPYQKNSTRWIGWLLTACAISLGAIFWFDLLSKLISLRNAGNKPDTATNTDNSNSPINRVG